MIGLARDDVQARLRERLAVCERGVGDDRTEHTVAKDCVGKQRIAFWNQHRAAQRDNRAGDRCKRARRCVTDWCGGHEADRKRAEIGGDRCSGRERFQPFGEPPFDLVERLRDAAVELHARPAEAIRGQVGGLEFMVHHVVRDFFATVFEQQRGSDIRMREVAAVGAPEHLEKRLAGGAACLGVRERDEAGDSLRAADLFLV